MNTEELREKVAKAEAKVEKCKKTLERHKSGLAKKIATNTIRDDIETRYAIRQKEDDIESGTRKLTEAEKVLDNWIKKLELSIEKERYINENAPQVIKDFLEDWKTKSFSWHKKRYEDYFIKQKELREARLDTIEKFGLERQLEESLVNFEKHSKEYFAFYSEKKEELDELLLQKGQTHSDISDILNSFAGHNVMTMVRYKDKEKAFEWLEDMVEREKMNKLYDLIHRIEDVAGKITEASFLRVSVKGNLDGFITGEKGKVEIQTISAGGYNIQCFHYRTLIHPIK